MNKRHWLLGGALLLLALKSKTVSRAGQAPLAATIAASQAAQELSKQPGGEGLSADGQLKILKPLLQGSSPSGNRVEGLEVAYDAPFDWQGRKPNARQIAILYSIDPNFEIANGPSGKKKIADLLGDALWEQPELRATVLFADQSDRIKNGLSLLPYPKIVEFGMQLLHHATPVFAEKGLASFYAEYLRLVAWNVQKGINMGERAMGEHEERVRNRLERVPGMRRFMQSVEVAFYYSRHSRQAKDYFHLAMFEVADDARRAAEKQYRDQSSATQKEAIDRHEYRTRSRMEDELSRERIERAQRDRLAFEEGRYDQPTGYSESLLQPDEFTEMKHRGESAAKQRADDLLEILAKELK